MKRMPPPIRWLGYVWALPVTAPALLLVAVVVATGGRVTAHTGVVEAHGGVGAWLLRRLVPLRGGASAMTLGHVVVGRDAGCLQRTRAHERAHVVQYEWLGGLFVPAYAAASVIAHLQGRHYYRDNVFERDAVAVAAVRLERPR
ncbi:MAG TPA: hypothetical protein VFX92_02955 [Candidatus Krumholzibacteria bacterium]|nr:hypothetical protein [Candidatus Krumholzibacteria bacterium]